MLIDYDKLTKDLDITGVIHVGAHTQEEAKYYKCPVKWVEADKELFDRMKGDKHWFAATNYNGTATFHLMPFKAANSLLEPNLNSKRRKDVYVEKTVEVPARRIDTIQEPGYNFLNLDIQGAELNALKGTDLSLIDYIYTEVHEVETYHNCTKVWELDEFLKDFTRVETQMTKHKWGDALYVRDNTNH